MKEFFADDDIEDVYEILRDRVNKVRVCYVSANANNDSIYDEEGRPHPDPLNLGGPSY